MVPLSTSRARRLGWLLFALQCLGVFVYAVVVDRRVRRQVVSGAIAADGTRFGLSEAERRKLFQELTRGEPADRRSSLEYKEGSVWNRNRDDLFHQAEWRRIAGAGRLAPEWMAYLILDEGIRNHWPAAPGVEVRADDAPLAPTTRPIAEHPVLTAGEGTAEPQPLPIRIR
jgi:hypothetical protein